MINANFVRYESQNYCKNTTFNFKKINENDFKQNTNLDKNYL